MSARQDTTAVSRLIAEERLPNDYAAKALPVWERLADRVATWRDQIAGRGLILGVAGPQGSGKSTVSRFLSEALLPARNLSTVAVGLDEFYLSRADREQLARTVHPLLATRGVPGTHDAKALRDALLTLSRSGERVALPTFDKSVDDRSGAVERAGPFDVVILEGWCVGARPSGVLSPALNAIEAEEDPDQRWRAYVNEQLAADYASLFAALDRLIYLRPPGWAEITAQRQRQEAKLRASTGRGMGEAEIERFMAHYERITRAMLRETPGYADVTISTDATGNPLDG